MPGDQLVEYIRFRNIEKLLDRNGHVRRIRRHRSKKHNCEQEGQRIRLTVERWLMKDRKLVVEIVEKLPNKVPHVCLSKYKACELCVKIFSCVTVTFEYRVLVGR